MDILFHSKVLQKKLRRPAAYQRKALAYKLELFVSH